MLNETSLSWHGPMWYAGRKGPGSAGNIPGLSSDVDTLEAFKREVDLPDVLPSAVLLDADKVPGDELAGIIAYLERQIDRLPVEIPFVILASGEVELPKDLRPHAIIEGSIPDDALFESMCALQRAIVRSEESRIRRITLGRVPNYGSAPHHTGGTGLLVIGLGHRFLELKQASSHKVEVFGAFTQEMGETFLQQRAFDAVILDGPVDQSLQTLEQLRRDSRFASIPVLAFADTPEASREFFYSGANDVLNANTAGHNLALRLATAIRSGKRRRLADRALAESHAWLRWQLAGGGLSTTRYEDYLAKIGTAFSARSLNITEIRLAGADLDGITSGGMLAGDLHSTILSVADAASRDEDLVCQVQGIGPVAVLKSERGAARLRSRVNAILGHTVL